MHRHESPYPAAPPPPRVLKPGANGRVPLHLTVRQARRAEACGQGIRTTLRALERAGMGPIREDDPVSILAMAQAGANAGDIIWALGLDILPEMRACAVMRETCARVMEQYDRRELARLIRADERALAYRWCRENNDWIFPTPDSEESDQEGWQRWLYAIDEDAEDWHHDGSDECDDGECDCGEVLDRHARAALIAALVEDENGDWR